MKMKPYQYKKLAYGFAVASIALLLEGCPIPMSNHISQASTPAALPYSPQSNQALVYIVQPYRVVDWFLVGGMASDGDHYSSRFSLQSLQNHSTVYIGDLGDFVSGGNSLCFYVNPGQYILNVNNFDSATPPTLQMNLNLAAGSVQIIALERTSYSGGTNNSVSLHTLDYNTGTQYVHQSTVVNCRNPFTEGSLLPGMWGAANARS